MNREQIIQMAQECGAMTGTGSVQFRVSDDSIERFAAAIRAAVKEEDAKICEEKAAEKPCYKEYEDNYIDGWLDANNECGWAIRASK